MSEHTPGPWNLWVGPKGAFQITKGDDGAVLASRTDWDHRSLESIANARLISAAPDLLAALRAMVDRWEPDTEGLDRVMWENACAAIDKATGQGSGA